MDREHEILVSEQVLQVPYKYSAGPVASRFLVALRDEGKLLGLKCDGCGRVYVPPREICGACWKRMEEWVEVGPGGGLENFTVVHYREDLHPAPAPFVLGLIRLEGADTCLAHLVLGDPEQLEIGMRVRPVFAETRQGCILDLAGFAAGS